MSKFPYLHKSQRLLAHTGLRVLNALFDHHPRQLEVVGSVLVAGPDSGERPAPDRDFGVAEVEHQRRQPEAVNRK